MKKHGTAHEKKTKNKKQQKIKQNLVPTLICILISAMDKTFEEFKTYLIKLLTDSMKHSTQMEI